jgi:hypothetical protein
MPEIPKYLTCFANFKQPQAGLIESPYIQHQKGRFDMKRSRFSKEQIVAILREFEAGDPNKELRRKHGVSDATFY